MINLSEPRSGYQAKDQQLGWRTKAEVKLNEAQDRSKKAKLSIRTAKKSTSKGQTLKSELLKVNLSKPISEKPKWINLRMPTNEDRLEAKTR